MVKTVDDLYDEHYAKPFGQPAAYVPAPTPPAAVPNSGIGGLDIVTHPGHYTSHPSGIEVIEITRHETFLRGNILKYVLRAPYKSREVEDLKKARQYLDWEIERAEREEGKHGAANR